jgi:hypothetical protein
VLFCANKADICTARTSGLTGVLIGERFARYGREKCATAVKRKDIWEVWRIPLFMAAQKEDGSKRVSICGAGQCFALYRHKAPDVIGTPDHPVHIEANIDGGL